MKLPAIWICLALLATAQLCRADADGVDLSVLSPDQLQSFINGLTPEDKADLMSDNVDKAKWEDKIMAYIAQVAPATPAVTAQDGPKDDLFKTPIVDFLKGWQPGSAVDQLLGGFGLGGLGSLPFGLSDSLQTLSKLFPLPNQPNPLEDPIFKLLDEWDGALVTIAKTSGLKDEDIKTIKNLGCGAVKAVSKTPSFADSVDRLLRSKGGFSRLANHLCPDYKAGNILQDILGLSVFAGAGDGKKIGLGDDIKKGILDGGKLGGIGDGKLLPDASKIGSGDYIKKGLLLDGAAKIGSGDYIKKALGLGVAGKLAGVGDGKLLPDVSHIGSGEYIKKGLDALALGGGQPKLGAGLGLLKPQEDAAKAAVTKSVVDAIIPKPKPYPVPKLEVQPVVVPKLKP